MAAAPDSLLSSRLRAATNPQPRTLEVTLRPSRSKIPCHTQIVPEAQAVESQGEPCRHREGSVGNPL